jgi:beta-lactamase regulating signal transducer with metallopeptidase domain/protocatechuate 3,4-dioxygenase beta subunit
MIEFLNSTAETWFRAMTSATLQAVLLALAILAVIGLLRHRSPALRHALLMIALLKFAVPPTLSLPTGLFSQLNPEPAPSILRSVPYMAPIAPIVDEVLWPPEPPAKTTAQLIAGASPALNRPAGTPVAPWPARSRPTMKSWLMSMHVFSVLVFLTIVIIEKRRLRRLSMRAEEAADEALRLIFDDLCGKIKLPRKPRLLISALNHSPMTFGTWRPVVLVPRTLVATLTPEELRVILGHELAHQRRWDLWLSWLQIPIAAIWWFNPVYWLLSRRIRSVREDCCDDLVVASGLASGEAYCDTLLQAARVASGCALNGAALAYVDESHPLRRRLKRIMTSKLITKPRLAWTGIIIVILLALLFLPGIRKRSSVQNPDSAAGEQKSVVPASNAALPPAANAGAPNLAIPPVSDGIPATEIQVRVVERATGRPVPNAALLLAAAMAVKDMVVADAPRTGSDGRCTIPAPKASTWLTVRADGFVPRHLRLPSPETTPDEFICKLDKGSSIGGYVRDEEGKPLENVKLSIYSTNTLFDSKQEARDLEGHDNWVYAQTDKGGRWTVTELVPDPERIQLTLDHPERVTTKYDTVTLPGTPIIGGTLTERASMSDLREGKAILVMKNGLVVSGIVMNETGRGIEGGEIIQYDGRSSPGIDWMIDPAKTDANGQFAVRIAKAGEVTIYVQAKGFAPEERALKAERGMAPVEFRLKEGEIVSGRVVDEGGNPIPNASIRTGNAMPGRSAPFAWTGKTDDTGRFLWDSAPAKPLTYYISAAGYDSPGSMVLEPAKAHEIRLTRGSELTITGKVTDAKTKMPIDNFKVSLSVMQNAMRSVEGNGGEFTLTLPVRSAPATIGGRTMPPPTYGILVEAEGYLPDLSQSVEAKSGNLRLEIALVRGTGFSGAVMLPNGNPASNANVFLCGGSTTSDSPSGVIMMGGPTMMNNIKSVQCSGGSGGSPFATAAETDASGKFTLKAVPQPHSFYAVHEKGFAAISSENLPASGDIKLQPWGQITGIVMIGRKPGANQSLFLSTLDMISRPPALRVTLTGVTDSEGRFEFASVPPGEYRISARSATGLSGQSADAEARSGETATVRIGGTGRPIVGKLVIPGADSNAPPKIQSASLALKLPDENIPSPSDAIAYRAYMESEAGRARQRMQHSYAIRPDADGSFRLEDIPAGTYTLSIMTTSPQQSTSQPGRPPGYERFTREVVVPEMPGGRSDEPLNLGIITLQLPQKK